MDTRVDHKNRVDRYALIPASELNNFVREQGLGYQWKLYGIDLLHSHADPETDLKSKHLVIIKGADGYGISSTLRRSRGFAFIDPFTREVKFLNEKKGLIPAKLDADFMVIRLQNDHAIPWRGRYSVSNGRWTRLRAP